MLNQNHTSIVAPRFLPLVCLCSNSEVYSDCIVGDPTYKEIDFCVDCGKAAKLEDALFQARVAVNPQFEQDSHVLDYLIVRLENAPEKCFWEGGSNLCKKCSDCNEHYL